MAISMSGRTVMMVILVVALWGCDSTGNVSVGGGRLAGLCDLLTSLGVFMGGLGLLWIACVYERQGKKPWR